jgi:ectoine hydroxylase
MKLTTQQLRRYRDDGFLLVPGAFTASDVAECKAALPAVCAHDDPAVVWETDGTTMRSVYASHRRHEVFREMSEDARLVEPAMQIVDSDVYIYQFKINAKAAFAGDVWEWHQDYIFWREEDGMPAPRVVNVGLFVDEVTEFNGPMFFIPGSHTGGAIDLAATKPVAQPAAQEGASDAPSWMSNVSAKLNYALDRETVAGLCARHGLASPKGPAGSLLLFDSNVVHGSPSNISPQTRVMLISTYNSVHNVPGRGRAGRPDFLVNRDSTPVRPVSRSVIAS